MINVGFIPWASKDWIGGVNYLRNLLYAIKTLENRKIEPIIFLGKKTDSFIIEAFQPYAEIVQDDLFDRKSLKWWIGQFFTKGLDSPFLINQLIKKHQLSVLSHSDMTMTGLHCKKVNWIADLQHLHLPEMFSDEEIKFRNALNHKLFTYSDAIIVSSSDAYNDCHSCISNPNDLKKVNVLQFVSQPSAKMQEDNDLAIAKKYQSEQKFFFLPNQFWKHKNHLRVFRAVKNLKQAGLEIIVLCSGAMVDFRNPEYIDEVKSFIKENLLETNIKLLGLIDYSEVIYLMRHSIAVINPSLFEGWSSTVEECKSIGKNMILSNINVHIEQAPPESYFFDLEEKSDLENQIKKMWIEVQETPNVRLEALAAKKLLHRTQEFGLQYQTIIEKVLVSEATNDR